MEQTLLASESKHHCQWPPQSQKSSSWRTRAFNCLPVASLLFLTANAADSAYWSRHDPWALASVAFCYADLVLLYLCLRSLERLGPDSPLDKREALKAAAWVLTTFLNVAFSWRLAEMMPPVLGVVVCLMGGSVAVGGFYFLFMFRDAHNNTAVENKELCSEEKV